MQALDASLEALQASWDRIIELGRKAGPAAEERAHAFVVAQMARVRGEIDGLEVFMSGKGN